MKIIDEPELLSRSGSTVKQFGLIAGIAAEGFLIDLDYGLEDEAVLAKVQVKKTGEDDCRFRVTGRYTGSAEEALRAILWVLEERIAYNPDEAAVTYSVQADRILVRFLTHHPSIGAATVCISAAPSP